MSQTTLKIADYSNDPWGRNAEDNAQGLNGAKFRETYLIPALRQNDIVIIDFNGLRDLLDSAFLGGVFVDLVKFDGFTYDDVRERVKVQSNLKYYETTIARLLELAQSEPQRLQQASARLF